MEIKNLKELQLKEYAITQPEVETLLNYLGQRPWVEVNDLMVTKGLFKSCETV